MNTVINVENLSKLYRLGEIGTGTISKDIQRWFTMNVLGNEDPYLKIGQTNDRTQKGESNIVYSLQNINFEIKQGDTVGIIGRNGAGKSTLLKILSRVTSPTTGKINVKGRVASLLEVGTGFHPELTGRENIYLNGAIMGMRKHEITSKLDEIVAFSGVERYLDTPVKRYSSGMYVRLAFAVAAHLEPDILIVDEVLAVGDYEFQKKAIGKMKSVSEGGGRTVLFVSHNMASLKQLCKSGILLKNGEIAYTGDIESTIDAYQNIEKNAISNIDSLNFDSDQRLKNENIELLSFNISPNSGEYLTNKSGVKIAYTFFNHKAATNVGTTIEIKTLDDTLILHKGTFVTKENNSVKGVYEVTFTIPADILNTGEYKIGVIFGENARYTLLRVDNLATFKIEWEADKNTYKILPGILSIDLNPIVRQISN